MNRALVRILHGRLRRRPGLEKRCIDHLEDRIVAVADDILLVVARNLVGRSVEHRRSDGGLGCCNRTGPTWFRN